MPPLLDKFERVQQYCVNGQLAIKTEGMEDTFKDIAVYSTLAMILFRKEQERTMEERFNLEPVDNLDARLNKMKESAEKIIAERAKDKEYENMHPMQAMRQIAEEQQEEEAWQGRWQRRKRGSGTPRKHHQDTLEEGFSSTNLSKIGLGVERTCKRKRN